MLSDAEIEQIAKAVAAKLAAPPAAHPEWADKLRNPYGSERAFLDAARRGDFKTFRRATRITARWVDVAAAIELTRGAGRRLKPGRSEPDVDIDKLVADGKPRRGRVNAHG